MTREERKALNKKKKLEYKERLAAYSKLLKNDRDWDYMYIIDMLVLKLSRVRKCLLSSESRGLKASDKMPMQIAEVVSLLTKIKNETHHTEGWKKLKAKWGNLKHKFEKKEGGGSVYKSWFAKETPQNKDQVAKDFTKFMDEAYKQKLADMNKAMSIIANHIWEWWD